MKSRRNLAVIILAAGKGTRMNNPDMAKVMFPINGKPMLEYVLERAARVGSSRTVVVVGWQKESVISYFQKKSGNLVFVEQTPQLGTGHAVMQAENALDGFAGDVLVLSGDVPLLSSKTISSLVEHHRTTNACATVLTSMIDNPTGYGRILRNPEGLVLAIVEHKDAAAEELKVREVNSGIYVFDKDLLFEALNHITPENAQKEYYLTDVFGYFWKGKKKVAALASPDWRETSGINTIQQLEEARELMAGLVDYKN